MHNRFVLITGCSGGGKSTLLAELRARGHQVTEEPGRRIVKEQLAAGGSALPWKDALAFTEKAIATALCDRELVASGSGWAFFDRGLIDAASAQQQLSGVPVLQKLNSLYPYHHRVFVAPPWREIYSTDAERRGEFEAGVEEYERLIAELPTLGYEVVMLPKLPVSARADFVLTTLGAQF